MMRARKCQPYQMLVTLPQIFVVRHVHTNACTRVNRGERHKSSQNSFCILVVLLLLAGLGGAHAVEEHHI